ncbi:general substrate transporter [Cutaneotrichosporon oleaginosum]|uniref:General substrate transporter n=1 Tax=Cutaneotrichosporon oleaginosum TaxID=879819 RepID=A0A0J1B7S9_9TREE|nr:general substrate transporter [Cutaneotrichosporon oleaginosum]KLT43819.1 general substrate transporter [Cutaneotrichosporon oleaginosum]TXT06439.1 hypothetical protein COLE_05770 [Cutaneotrichosporon oleaginosum]
MAIATNHLLMVPNNTHPQWWRDKGMRQNVLHCIGCCLCVFYIGYDQSLLSALQSIPQWNEFFDNPKDMWLGLIAASLFFPALITVFISSWISQRFGRRPAIWVGASLIVAGGLLNGLAQNTGQFIGGRALLGAGGAMTKVCAAPLLNELAHPRIRERMAASYYGWYFVGSTISAWLCLGGIYIKGDWGWRLPCIFQAFVPFLVILITFLAPESPRFLVGKGRPEEALRVLAKYHANGKEDDPMVQLEFNEIIVALESEGEEKDTHWRDLIKTPGNRRRTCMVVLIAFGTNWLGNALIAYYLTPVLRSVGVTSAVQTCSLNAGLAMWNVVICQTAAFFVPKISRRVSFFTSHGGMIKDTVKNANIGLATVPFLFIFYGFYDIAWQILQFHYPTEILPFRLRTKGLALFTACQVGANSFNQFVNPIALGRIKWRYYLVYIFINIAYVIYFYFYLIDTRGLPLEEVTMLFDYPRKDARRMAREEMEKRVAAEEERTRGTHKLQAVNSRGSGEKDVVNHVERV